MDLSEFVEKTLRQIADGLAAAQKHVHEKGGAVNPPHHYGGIYKGALWNDAPIGQVDFDVALITEETGELGGRISVFGIGVGGASETTEKSVSRIKFSVPIAFPTWGGEHESG